MAPLRPHTFREVERKLLRMGFEPVGQRGSHVKFSKADEAGVRTVIVPQHREVAVGTLRSIMRQAGLSPEQFVDL